MLECPACRASLGWESLAAEGPTRCPHCGATLEISVFPALLRPLAAGQLGETIHSDQESACFYHPRRQAVVPCESCGRFLCSLCDVDFNGRHVCAPCLESARGQGALPNLEARRTRHDLIAMAVAIYPIVPFIFPTLFTAPVALYLAARALRAPGSLVHATKLRCILAMLLATAQIVTWALVINLILTETRTGG